jgi:hypothetical protein
LQPAGRAVTFHKADSAFTVHGGARKPAANDYSAVHSSGKEPGRGCPRF